ncbi:glycosyltransferase [Gramella sp. GC03-9]|uniref:Glycosyltransferase n=1 Tax=Christiangramia oceanisediminis TaxID=2920386 RepID=A0A9X2KVM0_9FLAO|nr:glycosyltransferase family 2 protein [Gramella oceanisediminis]MCP9199317.1 glycosyltransferase [Gramella oceanisediminis]
MQDYGLVSVVMPAYDSEAFISEAIQSVISQTYPNWELIVVDDGSSDATPKIIQEFIAADDRIKLVRNDRNQGTHIARNKAIEAAGGNFIAFLDADDRWKAEKLQKQLELMIEKNLAACFSSYDLIDEMGNSLGKKVEALEELSYEKLLKANYVGNLTGIYSLDKLGKIYCPDIKKRQDWALWLEVVRKSGPIDGIQESLAVYRIRKGSISGNKLEMLKYNFQVYQKVLGYGSFKSTWKMLIFLNEQFFIKSKQVKPLPPGK